MKRKCLLVVITFFLTLTCAFSQEEITTINIINALKTDYTKDADTGNECIVLEGAVELSVAKGNTQALIKANKVTYDRKTKMLYADGDVYVTTSGNSSGNENITASSMIMNTSTLEGVFDGGRVIQTQSDAVSLPSGSTLIVFSNLFGKTDSNTIAFKNANLTFCEDEDPHWRIKASRIWLLPGGEFAFLNALLFVGVVPVFYLPAFYYPKDELIFNPTFGYKHREGFFVQTTAYIYGRKPLNNSSLSSSSSSTSPSDENFESLYNFLRLNKLKVQKREGIVLHNLDEDYKGDTTNYFKVMGDWYSNLGFMLGTDGNFVFEKNQKNPIDRISFGMYLGWSNPIFSNMNTFSSISPSGQKYWDQSSFLGIQMPFRYKTNFQIELSKPVTFSLSLPIYSDPYFGYDYGNRSEDFNWISSIREVLEKNKDVNTSTVSSFEWSMKTAYSPSIPDFIKPYISTFSINTTSSVNFSSLSADFVKFTEMLSNRYGNANLFIYTDLYPLASVSPERSFYYPAQVTPVSGSATISGTIFKWPYTNAKQSSKKIDKQLVIDLNKPEELMTEKELVLKQNEDLSEKNVQNESESNNEEKDIFEEIATLPNIPFKPKETAILPGFEYQLGYSIKPNVFTQFNYASMGLETPVDFSWENPRSFMYSIKFPTSINSSLTYGGNFFSMENNLLYSPIFQNHSYVLEIDEEKKNGGYTKSEIKALKKTDLVTSSQTIENSNTVTLKPLIAYPVFADSRISWNTNLKLFQYKFLADSDVDDPQWDRIWLKLDDNETVTTNELSLVLSTNEFLNKFKQVLTLSSTLPPIDEKYSASLNLIFPYVSANFRVGVYKKSTKLNTKKNDYEDEWHKDPFQQSLKISLPLLGNELSLSESFNYNLEDETPHPDSLKTSLSWFGFTFSYSMDYVLGYNFEKGVGWVENEKKSFQPSSLSLSYVSPSKTFYKWKNRLSISPGLSTVILYDFIKMTDSYFSFSPSLTFRLNEFLDLTFSATSRNSSIINYFDDRILGYRKNIFTDLINSFRFDNESLRRASGFKLKSLNLTISHDLHDWKFKMAFKIEPKLVTRMKNGKMRSEYIFDPYLVIGVTWNPMESIRTNIVNKYDSSYSEYESDGVTKKGTGYYIWGLE